MYSLTNEQLSHVDEIKQKILLNNRYLDTSKTGSGKTDTAIMACKLLNMEPLVITTKINIEYWKKKMNDYKLKYYGISNYELLRYFKYYYNDKKTAIPFIDDKYNINIHLLPQIIIYDEVHKCKNINTQNGAILYNLSAIKHLNILCLSATTNDLQSQLVFLGYILKMYNSIDEGKKYLIEQSKNDKNIMLTFNKLMYPNYAGMIKQQENKTFQNKIYANAYECENDELILKEYELINNEKNKEIKRSSIKKIHQKIEILLLPIFLKLIKDNPNKSIVVFLNFTKSIEILSKQLQCDCLIYGKIPMNTRLNNLKLFNDNIKKLIICNIQCAATGINLQDIHGNNERISLISPSLSTQDLLQALGRINRFGTKSETEQFIIFSNCKYGIGMCNIIRDKINNIGLLNDGEQQKSNIKIEGLIENYKDKTHIHKELNITKKDLINIEKEKEIKEKKEREIIKKNELPVECMDVNAIMKKLKYLKYKQSISNDQDKITATDELNHYKKLLSEKIKSMI